MRNFEGTGLALQLAVATIALVMAPGCSDSGPKPKPPTPVTAAPQGGPSAPGASGNAPAGGPTGASTGATPTASTTQPTSAPTPGDPARATTPPVRGAAGNAAVAGRLSGPDTDATRVEIIGLVMPKPVAWTWQKPSMQFRTLQYAVPAPGGASPAAELIFSVFPAGDGGPIQPNIDRWVGQFRSEGGEPVAPTNQSTVDRDGLRMTRLDLHGSYMGMGAAAPRPKSAQLGAIIEAPDGTLFIRLLGAEATVEAARKDFDAMLAGISRAETYAAPKQPSK